MPVLQSEGVICQSIGHSRSLNGQSEHLNFVASGCLMSKVIGQALSLAEKELAAGICQCLKAYQLTMCLTLQWGAMELATSS